MAPRPDVSQERKIQILDAAQRVFAQQGFAAARMDDIVAEAGLSKGGVYWYFEGKDAIVLALMERFFSGVMDSEVARLLEAPDPARERLLALIRIVAQAGVEMAPLLPVVYEYYATAMRHDEVRAFFQRYFEAYRIALGEFISQGVAAGEFHPVAADRTATSLIGLIEGLMLIWSVDPEAFDLAAQAESGVSVFLDGLARTPTGEA
jgi:TetR/AcrR family fatty acid metabolism transcriptional regulator